MATARLQIVVPFVPSLEHLCVREKGFLCLGLGLGLGLRMAVPRVQELISMKWRTKVMCATCDSNKKKCVNIIATVNNQEIIKTTS